MNNKKDKKLSIIFKNSIYLAKLIMEYSPMLFVGTIIAAIIEFILSFMNLFYTKVLVQSIVDEMEYNKILVIMILWCVLYITMRFGIIIIDNYIKPVYSKVLLKGLGKFLYDKAASFDLSCYDDSNFYNEYIWATNNAGEIVISASDTIGAFLRYILQISGIVSVVLLIDPSLSIITVISVTITLLVTASIEKLKIAYRKECTSDEKRKMYVERMFYLQSSAKDLRLTKVKNKFLRIYNEAFKGLCKTIKKRAYKITLYSFGSTFLFRYVINTFFVYGFFSYKLLISKTLDISEFVVINSAMVSLYLSLTRWSDQISQLYKNSLYIETMKGFIEYKPKVVSKDNPRTVDLKENYCIEFKNVTFTYPGEKKPTLEDVSFKIYSNQILAIVGYNGAGKTTLVKLLLRLYDTEKGEILLNNININEYDIKEYRNIFSTVFQDFQLYATSLGENIMLDEVNQSNINNLNKAVKLADFESKFKTFKKGFETQVTREFDDEGVLLSGGEMQKISIARVLAKDSSIYVLDEPSAALDPISEYEINKTLANVSSDKTVILISHRLTSTSMADNIIMLENGKIIEQGSHKELLNLDAKYAYMYKLQAKPYK